jgi:hypothetical protein
MTLETKMLEIIISPYNIKAMFSVISSLTNPMIIKLLALLDARDTDKLNIKLFILKHQIISFNFANMFGTNHDL